MTIVLGNKSTNHNGVDWMLEFKEAGQIVDEVYVEPANLYRFIDLRRRWVGGGITEEALILELDKYRGLIQ